MGSFSISHWLIVLLIVLLIFGTKRLRTVGSDLGGAIRAFKDARIESENEAAMPQKADQQETHPI